VHALPGCRLQVEGADGDVLVIGYDERCDLSPCDLRCGLITGGSFERLPPTPINARLLDDPPTTCHVGLGLYRFVDGDCFGFAGATFLSPDRIAEVIEQSVDDDEADPFAEEPYNLIGDEPLGVTLLYTRHAVPAGATAVAAAERHALRAFVACLAAELTDSVSGSSAGGAP
jgi:hypothetical protein